MIGTPLFIIFSWPRRQKHYGGAEAVYCPHCHNNVVVHVLKERRWLELFWIPVLPLGTSQHYLMCEICGASVEIGGDAAEKYKTLTTYAQQYATDAISEREYFEHVDAAHESIEDKIDTEEEVLQLTLADQSEGGSIGGGITDTLDCPECGFKADVADVYCDECGTNLRNPDTSPEGSATS